MRNRKLAISLALGALAAGCYAGYRRSQARPAAAAAAPEPLQTWEGEGGGVPVDSHHAAAPVEPPERPGDRQDDAPGGAADDGSPAGVGDSRGAARRASSLS